VDGPGKERLRIGLVREASRGLPVAPDVVQATDETARLLEELGHRVEEIAPPVADDFGPDFLRYWGFLAFALTRGGRLLFGRGFDPSRCEPFTLELARFFLRRAERFPASLRRLRAVAAGGGAVPGFDIVLSPVLAHEPARLGQLGADVGFHDQVLRLLRYSSFTPLQNVTGAPAISLPLGLSATGLPVGVQLGAALGQERRLLELAFELETTTLFRRNATSVR
jgi:amidase